MRSSSGEIKKVAFEGLSRGEALSQGSRQCGVLLKNRKFKDYILQVCGVWCVLTTY
jgi:hypothetical protein